MIDKLSCISQLFAYLHIFFAYSSLVGALLVWVKLASLASASHRFDPIQRKRSVLPGGVNWVTEVL